MEHPIIGEDWGSRQLEEPQPEQGAAVLSLAVTKDEGEPRWQAGRVELTKGLFGDRRDRFAVANNPRPVDHPVDQHHPPPIPDVNQGGTQTEEGQMIDDKISYNDQHTTPPMDEKCKFDEKEFCVTHDTQTVVCMVTSKKWGYIKSKNCHGWKYIKTRKLICKPSSRVGLKPGYNTQKPTFDIYKSSEPDGNSLDKISGEGDTVAGEILSNFSDDTEVNIGDAERLSGEGLANGEGKTE